MIAALVLPLIGLAVSLGPDDSPLAVIRPAPSVAHIDHDGRPFSLEALRGKAVVVSFVFTTCTGTCPATTSRLVQVQRKLRSAGLWGDSVSFVSITLDPARDSPPALKSYGASQGADLSHWTFATGSVADVARVWRAWDMWARLTPQGAIDHPSRIFLVDPAGRIREIYDLETLRPEVVIQDIQQVITG
jgi:protein SCO1/2